VFYFKEVSKIKNFKEYQAEAIRSLRPETDLERLGLLLVSHVGAVSKLQYTALKSGVMNTDDLCIELGECLWCVAAIGHLKGFSPKTEDKWPDWNDATKRNGAETIISLARVAETLFHEPSKGNGVLNGMFCLEHCLRHINAIAQLNNLNINKIAQVNLAKARP
jgi:hypothetical protein